MYITPIEADWDKEKIEKQESITHNFVQLQRILPAKRTKFDHLVEKSIVSYINDNTSMSLALYPSSARDSSAHDLFTNALA